MTFIAPANPPGPFFPMHHDSDFVVNAGTEATLQEAFASTGTRTERYLSVGLKAVPMWTTFMNTEGSVRSFFPAYANYWTFVRGNSFTQDGGSCLFSYNGNLHRVTLQGWGFRGR